MLLVDDAGDAETNELECLVVREAGRDEQDAPLEPAIAQSAHERQRVVFAEVVVEDQHVDAALRDGRERPVDGVGAPNHLQERVALEQAKQPFAEERMVVDDEEPDGGAHTVYGSTGSSGRITSNWQPLSVGTYRRSPPKVRTSARDT